MVAERRLHDPTHDKPCESTDVSHDVIGKMIPQQRIQQRIIEQTVDVPIPQKHGDFTDANNAFIEETADALGQNPTEATQVLQSETDGADGHTYSLFQENSSDALQTPTDLVMTAVKQLAEQEHFAALAQLRSRISPITKSDADDGNDPFVKVQDLITDLIRLQTEASPETNQKSYCDEETSKATEKEDRDLLSVAYKNAVDSRRAAWRVITSVEQKEKSQGEEQLASYAREYIAKVENELHKIREGVLALMDKKLVPPPCTDESKARLLPIPCRMCNR